MTASAPGLFAAAPRRAAGGAGAAPYLEVRGLRKRYGDTDVLRDVSFAIAEGEFVCFLGPSGCGKTTLLMCLAGLEQAQAGDILKQGASIGQLPPSRRDVGIVFQSYALFPNLTVFDNVAFGLVSQRRPRPEIDATVAELMRCCRCRGTSTSSPASCRAASSSAWRWRARWRCRPRCCCWTSRCRRWTRRCARACAANCASCRRGWG
jgi:ABC-type glutathione transport system ATPase component